MNCYRCDSENLPLAPLTPWERETYSEAGIVMRRCGHCGLEQSHSGDDDLMSSLVAAQEAPDAL